MANVGFERRVAALERAGVAAFHMHRMNPDHLHRLRENRRAHAWVVPPVLPTSEQRPCRLQRRSGWIT
jgi:hypothetical protein